MNVVKAARARGWDQYIIIICLRMFYMRYKRKVFTGKDLKIYGINFNSLTPLGDSILKIQINSLQCNNFVNNAIKFFMMMSSLIKIK